MLKKYIYVGFHYIPFRPSDVITRGMNRKGLTTTLQINVLSCFVQILHRICYIYESYKISISMPVILENVPIKN